MHSAVQRRRQYFTLRRRLRDGLGRCDVHGKIDRLRLGIEGPAGQHKRLLIALLLIARHEPAAIAASGSISGSGCDRAKMTWPGRTISGEMTWPLEVVAMTMSALLMISSKGMITPPSASCLLALISDRVDPQTGFPV